MMGNLVGNVFALLIVIASVGAAIIFGFWPGALTFAVLAYAAFVAIVAAYYATMPKNSSFLFFLSQRESEAFRIYHLIVWAPGASVLFSSLLNLVRLAGIGWGITSFIKGEYFLGAVSLALFPLTSLYVVRFDPFRYMVPGAASGNAVAIEQMALIERIISQYRLFRDNQ